MNERQSVTIECIVSNRAYFNSADDRRIYIVPRIITSTIQEKYIVVILFKGKHFKR